MESARLWKARQEAGGLPTTFGKRPRPPPAFPTATTAPASDPAKSLTSKPHQAKPRDQVTLGCWHLSDAELLALRRYLLSRLLIFLPTCTSFHPNLPTC